MSLYSMAFLGIAPIGSLLGGFLAARIGAPETVQIAGGFCIVAGGLFSRQLPQLRTLVRPIYERAGILPKSVPVPTSIDS